MVWLPAVMMLAQVEDLGKILPLPTGKNGYESYIRAAQIASEGRASVYRLWLDRAVIQDPDEIVQRPPDIQTSDHDLDIRRKWNERFKRCLDLVEQGNRQPVYDPREAVGPSTRYPEMTHFRTLEQLEVNAARICFADGESRAGVQQLEQGFTFANKLGAHSIFISRLVGIACSSVAFGELDRHWPQYSLDDARELKSYFGEKLGAPETLISTIEGEKESVKGVFSSMAGDPQKYLENDPKIWDELGKRSRLDQQNTISDAEAKTVAYFDGMIQILRGPESGWLNFQDPPDDDSVMGRLTSMLVPAVSQVIQAEMKDRIRYRLAYLNACAVEFRWMNGRLPNQIEEFTTPDERIDPGSGQEYGYRKDSQWFRITREGHDALGQVGAYVAAKPAVSGSPHP